MPVYYTSHNGIHNYSPRGYGFGRLVNNSKQSNSASHFKFYLQVWSSFLHFKTLSYNKKLAMYKKNIMHKN